MGTKAYPSLQIQEWKYVSLDIEAASKLFKEYSNITKTTMHMLLRGRAKHWAPPNSTSKDSFIVQTPFN